MSVRAAALAEGARRGEGGWSNRNQICADRSVGPSVGRSVGRGRQLSPFNGIYRAQQSGRNVRVQYVHQRIETGLTRAYTYEIY